jgi:IS5 family transposase
LLLAFFLLKTNASIYKKLDTYLLNANHIDGKSKAKFFKEVKNCRLAIRHFRHVKKRAKAKKALTRLRTIANKLIRE